MPVQNTSEIKEKILLLLQRKGPGLPVHIARETGLSMLFASAFLSELYSENKIKISHMKVGNSPLYYLPQQEHQLERFSHHLKSKEKEAFLLLRDKKFLKDSAQEPAIRVALRVIRDFAIPFRKPDTQELIWRFFTVPETEFRIEEKPIIRKPTKSAKEKKSEKTAEKSLGIFDIKKIDTKKKPVKKNSEKKKISRSKKDNMKFFNKIKDFLSAKSTEIIGVEFFGKNEIILKTKSRDNDREEMLFAYNKKRVTEEDIIKAHKKVIEAKGLKYKILALGEPLKRTKEFIKALENLEEIQKIS